MRVVNRWHVLTLGCVVSALGLWWLKSSPSLRAHQVTVHNASTAPLTHVIFLDPAQRQHALRDVPAQAELTEGFEFGGEGSVRYELEWHGEKKTGLLVGYITGGLGSHATMNAEADGGLSVIETN